MPDLTVWPTDGADGSVSTEARWRKMARLWAPSGVTSGLAPTLAAGPTINVAIGAAWLDGHFAELPAPAVVPASANGLLVLRFTAADNRCELLYRDGITVPTQTDPTWELPIAQMAAGALQDRRATSSAWENAVFQVASNAGALITATGAGPPFTALPNSTLQLPAGAYLLLATFDINVITAAGGNLVTGVIYIPTATPGSSILTNYRGILDMNTVQRANVPAMALAVLAGPTPVQLGGIKNVGTGVVNIEQPSVLTAIRYG